jgi:hypothetical protein
LGKGCLGDEAIVADEVADDRAVLLSPWALSFFFHARLRVNVMPNR